MAPAMNVRMWRHPATVRNLEVLRGDGVSFVGPEDGPMACGEFGPGRMAEPAAIFEAIRTALQGSSQGPLAGRRALVTAGPTHEPLDPVRYIANRSSGKQGYAVAAALAALGADVTLVSGPTSLPAPTGVRRVDVVTADEMMQACRAALPADVAVMVAAVADWRPKDPASIKVKKAGGPPPVIRLEENQDILAAIAADGPSRPTLVVGFAAETNDLVVNAKAKLSSKGCDWIVANDVSLGGVMGGDENAAILFTRTGETQWPQAPKSALAARLADAVAKALG
jgi:phosphopantothenoylcysteine decarboxylase/phosphopantothenate--cysteine ligase